MTLGPGIKIDLDVLVNTRLLIQANSGGGKSYCIRRLLEQTHGRIQHLVIDPEGEFASLRSKFDYVLAAKRDGDTQVHPKSAKLLAVRLLELGVSAVLDIFELSPEDRKAFVRDFLDALVDAPKHLWHPALVVLDEAHVYCPEKGDSVASDAVKSIATRGRKRGFCLVPATQRLSKLDKDVAAECNNKLIGRTVLDVDIKRAADELGFTTQADRLTLRDLDAGEFFAFGPALAKSVTKFTVGQVQTEHPKAGAHLAPVVPPPTAKVLAVLSKLADLPQEAEKKAATEAELRAEIQRLNRELKAKPQPVAPSKPLTIEVPALTDADIQALARLHGCVQDITSAVQTVAAEVSAMNRAIVARLQSKPAPVKSVTPPRLAVVPQRRPPAAPIDGNLGKCERAILTVLAQYGACNSGRLTLLSGYRYSGGFKNSLATLRTQGLIEGENTGTIQITSDGEAAIGDVPAPGDMAAHWLTHPSFGKCERAILSALLDDGPGTAAELCQRTNYEYSGGFKNALANLRTAGVLVGRNTEQMSVADELT